MRAGFYGLLLCVALSALPAAAQQFDSFGDGPIEGFEMPSGGLDSLMPLPLDPGATIEGFGDGGDISLRPGIGQDDIRLDVFPGTGAAITSISQPETAQATRVTLRALDRMLGQPTDVELSVGETVIFGRIAIHVRDCRFPVQDPFSDAFALIEVLDLEGSRLFDGWMVASSPALNALEHPRYDVWVLRCTAE
jgi:hypothetical protein